MIKKTLLFLLLVVAALPLQAQKLYKIVDGDGNVSFSQYPPAEKKQNVSVEGVKVSGSAQSMVSEGLDGSYCGKIRLPKPSSQGTSSPSYLNKLESRRTTWQRELARLNERVDRNNQNSLNNSKYRSDSHKPQKYYQESIAKNGEKLRDLRCALSWTDKEFEGKEELIQNNKSERARLTRVKGELQAKLDSRCGELPAYDPNDRTNDYKRKTWYDCSKTMRREIDTVQREINKT